MQTKEKCNIVKRKSEVRQWVVIKVTIKAFLNGEPVFERQMILPSRYASHRRAREAVQRLMESVIASREIPPLRRTNATQWDLVFRSRHGRLSAQKRYRIGRKEVLKCSW